MIRALLVIALLMLPISLSAADELIAPDPGIAPGRVVEIQLSSLQRNDQPTLDFGIAQTWAFAHPENRRVTGPLERFTLMIKETDYRVLINHREHRIEPVSRTDAAAVFAVLLVTSDGRRVGFEWRLAKVQAGAFAGSWMTVAVSPPLRVGDTI